MVISDGGFPALLHPTPCPHYRTPPRGVLTLVLLSVKVKLVVPFSGMELAPKALAIVGGLMTLRLGLAVQVLPLPASAESIWTLLG